MRLRSTGTQSVYPLGPLPPGLAAGLRPGSAPLVNVDNASADQIAEVVMRCPSGALHFRRNDGQPGEPIPQETTVTPTPNGPLYMRGYIEVRDANGELLRKDTRVALCRCGASQNKPFCDNSHRRIEFRTE